MPLFTFFTPPQQICSQCNLDVRDETNTFLFMAGRPSKLKTARPKILRAIGDAITIRAACRMSGIDDSTFRKWRIQGIKDRDAGKKTELAAFVDAIEEAEARAEAKLVRAVQRKQPLEILKRRFPKEWGDKKLVALEGGDPENPIRTEGPSPVTLNLTIEDPDDEELWEDNDEEVEE